MHKTPLNSIQHQRILLSPLNWGLGHVTRTIPIIRALIHQKNEVFICCDSEQESYYRAYFPSLWYIPHKGYPFQFKGKGQWSLDILAGFLPLQECLKQEKKRVAALVDKFNPDFLISDQRYGFYSPDVHSIFISHQINLPVSNWNIFTKQWNKKLIRAFDEVWVPDNPTQKYSGKLSAGKIKNKRFIGTCSQFQDDSIEKFIPKEIDYKYLGIVSGPAPYNKQFLNLLIKKFREIDAPTGIIAPPNLWEDQIVTDNIEFISSPDPEQFLSLMLSSETIVSRAGYSTLMDLIETSRKGILIPTPGQKEQLYLSQLHNDHELWEFYTEKEFQRIEFN